MLPKINAVVSFLEQGGKKAVISRPEKLKEAVIGKAGTCIYGE
jgi:carbamate kinase